MYQVTYLHKNETTEKSLYIPGDQNYCLLDGQLHVAMGVSGELNIYIPDTNPARHDIECLTDEIIVYRDDKEIWRGRPVTLQVDFDLTGKLTCEGILSYLYDTYYPPFEFEGSPKELLQSVIDNHNSKVETRKQFQLGEITVEDSNDYINRSSIYYNRSLTILEEKFVGDSLGGYFRVRVEDGVRYLDYLTAYNTESSQPVEYGYNLLDIAQNVEYSDVASVVLPLGARLTDEDGLETDERLTVASVNNGDIYIVDDQAVETYGWIVQEIEWDDVTLPENLYDKGYYALTQLTSPISSFEITVVDLSWIDPEVDPINLGDFVRIRVDAFDVDQYVELTAMDIDLLNPADSVLDFGTQASTLTGTTNNTMRTIQENMGNLEAHFTNLSANVINAVYANIEHIIAETITTDYIRAAVADLGYVTADWVQANFADIEYLEATYATILDLDVAFENVELLNADVADIYNLLSGNVGAGDVQTIILTAENAVIEEAVIVNALMDTVLASVLTAGVIYTDYIKIADNEGQYLWIDGSTLQFKDSNGTVRVQIGMDGDGNYNYYLWDENGTLIWDPLGLTEAGLTGNGAIIKDEAVADDANISGYKLNIQEIAQILNETGDLILNATQVIIDGETLDYQLTQITQTLENLEMSGIVTIENWYSLGTQDAPYTDPGTITDQSTSSILGKMVLGEAVLGSSGTVSSWTLEQPNPDTGEYVWYVQKVTYVDGTEVWTTPTLLGDSYARNAITVQQTELSVIQGQIQDKIWMTDIETATDEVTGAITEIIDEQYGILTVTINAIDQRVGELETTVSDDYEALYSWITDISLSYGEIVEEVREVREWASESLTELSEQYAQVVINLGEINQEVVNVWAELTNNYSTTTEVSSLIDQAVTENSATIMERVAYEYVSQNDLGTTLSNYYTATDTEALILAQANETSSTILSQVSATYATQDYVTDMLKDLDLEGVTNLETYYCVSDNGTDSPDYTIYTSDDSFDGWNRWTYNSDSDGTYEVITDSTLGTYIRLVTTSETGYIGARYTIGTNFKPGTYRVSFKAATESGYEQTARWCIGLGGGYYWLYNGASGQLTSGQWTDCTHDFSLESTYTSGTFYIRLMGYGQNVPILYKDVSIELIADWSTEYPTVETGEYLWVRYLLTYNDGTTAWTEPFCATTNLSDYPTVSIMTATIEQYVDESQAYILSEVKSNYATIASIQEYVDESMAKISLTVSAEKAYLSATTDFSSWTKINSSAGSFGTYSSDRYGDYYYIQKTNSSSSTNPGIQKEVGSNLPAGTYKLKFEMCSLVSTSGKWGYSFGPASGATTYYTNSPNQGAANAIEVTHDFTIDGSDNSTYYLTFYAVDQSAQVGIRNVTLTTADASTASALGSIAGIYLSAGGTESLVGSLDLSAVRQSFADDPSSITISAGTVAFLSNTLIIESKCLELDASGNLTIDTNQFTLTSAGNATFSGNLSAPSGNIGGWTIGTSSLYNGTSSITSTTDGTYIGTNGIRQYNNGNYLTITDTTITNGNSDNNYVEMTNASVRYYNGGTNLGYYGTTTWVNTSIVGLSINAEYRNGFIVFGRKTSSSETIYTADYLINYNLGSSVIGYSEKHIFYGSARFTGSVSGISAASVTVEGNIYNTGDYYSASDTKVKADVNDMLDKVDSDDVIDRLEPVTYRLKDYDDGKLHMGLTYQNLQEAMKADGLDPDDMAIFSSIKDKDGEEIGMIAYSELIPVLISEIQTLKKEVNSLKTGNA